MDYEAGEKGKREFGQNIQYKQIVTIADNDVAEAERLLKESTLEGEKLILATDAVRDAKDRQNTLVDTTHRMSANDINTEVQNKRMSRQQLDILSKETTNVMGKEIPKVPKHVISANRAALDASEDFDALKFRGDFTNLNKLIKDLAGAGSIDWGTSEPEKVYTGIAVLGKKGASKASVESFLNLASMATTDYAEGRGWDNATVKVINDITDSQTTLYAEHPTKYKGVDPVGSIVTKLNSFMEVVEEHKGHPPAGAIKEWREENMGEIDKDLAIMNYSNTYRIGEREKVGTELRVYKGDGTYVVEGE
jgi:hypothetical protein